MKAIRQVESGLRFFTAFTFIDGVRVDTKTIFACPLAWHGLRLLAFDAFLRAFLRFVQSSAGNALKVDSISDGTDFNSSVLGFEQIFDKIHHRSSFGLITEINATSSRALECSKLYLRSVLVATNTHTLKAKFQVVEQDTERIKVCCVVTFTS
jgi:hypothetical protein